jgi:hypothetical protein
MTKRVLGLAVFAIFASGAGCSDDPAPPPFGPGAGGGGGADGGTGTQPNSSSSSGGSSGSAPDASVPYDAGYRDPQGSDSGCSAPNLVCNNKCVAVGSDVGNCGKCGNQCMGPGAACIAGSCTCTGTLFDYCDGTGCMDVSSDTNNCGKCGNVCDPNQFNACVAGVCVQNC